MTGLSEDPQVEAERYRNAIEMAVYAEQNGFDTVNLEEHHCAENGWLPSPITLAAMIIARTKTIRVNVAALLVTLYDPIRLAEEVAILDLVSGGRFSFVAGLGYRPIEYHATGRSWEDRGQSMDHCIETLLAAWTGEPFMYRGKKIRVTPRPLTRPHPLFLLGGMSPAAARRAARFGLPFMPPMDMPHLRSVYEAELLARGKQGFYVNPGAGNRMLLIDDDPESTWEELAPYFFRELNEYSGWKKEGVSRPGEEEVRTIEDLRKQDRFSILTAEDGRAQLGSQPDSGAVIHPLAGGIPVDRAWQLLKKFSQTLL
ncbi:MAG: LLM class flavin-dependent oxidoreductase [Myxococcota bacterium]|nr:LLM class flavin-dependent oxidoreductase [Myxococcota bacterium]